MSEGQDERKRGLSRRSLSPPEPSKVSLIQNRLLSKANRSVSDLSQGSGVKVRPASASRLIHSVRRTVSTTQLRHKSPSPLPPTSVDLLSPRVVKKALMGNVLKVRKETATGKEEHKIQVKLEVSKPGPSSSSGGGTLGSSLRKAKETLTLKSTSNGGKKESKKSPKSGSKLPKSVKICNTVSVQNGSSATQPLNVSSQPLKPPRKSKSVSEKNGKVSKSSPSTSRGTSNLVSPSTTTPTTSFSRPESPKTIQERLRRSFSRSPTPTPTSILSPQSPATGSKKVPRLATLNKTLSDGLSKMISHKLSKGSEQSAAPTTTGASLNGNKKIKKGEKAATTEKKEPNYTVTQKPLAPPADSTPGTTTNATKQRSITASYDYMSLPLVRRYHLESAAVYSSTPSLCSYSSHRSLPTLTPYLTETKRVTNSIFLRGRSPSPCPRPTKTSLMREIISRELPTTPLNFKDSTFKSSGSVATLENDSIKAAVSTSDLTVGGVKPRQRRRRSVSCLNLRDYSQYILALRHSHRHRSPRFSRLHKLYSSLERLCELEKSTVSLYDTPVLPSSKKNDFDAWWKVRNRLRIEEEIETISKELLQAQREREFFFRPKTPLSWCPVKDAHLRFKKWSVDELKSQLGEKKGSDVLKLDLYKTQWRGTSVKELALNLEVNDLYKKGGGVKIYEEVYEKRIPYLRRAFSMSSTLSEEQREGIKNRIGHLITTAAAKTNDSSGGSGRVSRASGGRAAHTSRMGFTLSSDPRKIENLKASPDSGLSESKKKEISQKLCEEFKERRVKESNILRDTFMSTDINHGALPVSTKIALRKSETFHQGTRRATPFYSVYCKNGVNNRIKAFEKGDSEDKQRKRIVHAVAPTPNHSLTPTAKVTKSKDFVRQANREAKLLQGSGPASLPPFRSQSPNFQRTPSPQRRSITPTRTAPPINKEYVSHINIISKLAALLLKRNTSLKSLVTREVLERDRLERLRFLNSGEVERLRDYFEDRQTFEDLRELAVKSPEINLLRCLFCSDQNLAKITEKLDPDHRRRCASAGGDIDSIVTAKRAAPDGSSPTPSPAKKKADFNLGAVKGSNSCIYLNTRSRKPIYQPSSTPNVCQPTLTAHCYLSQQNDSIERLESPELYDYGGGYDSLPLSYTYSSPSSLSSNAQHSPPRRILDERLRGFSYANYDPAAHQPRYRYVPQPPVLPNTVSPNVHMKRSGSAMAYAQHFPVGNVGALRRAESFHSTVGRRIQSPPYQGNQGYPHSMYQVVVKPPRKDGNVHASVTVGVVQTQPSNFARIASLKKFGKKVPLQETAV